MTRKQEQEIKDFLKKVGLQHSTFEQDENGRFYVVTRFQIGTYIITDFKQNLKNSLKDLVNLAEDYILKIDEN